MGCKKCLEVRGQRSLRKQAGLEAGPGAGWLNRWRDLVASEFRRNGGQRRSRRITGTEANKVDLLGRRLELVESDDNERTSD